MPDTSPARRSALPALHHLCIFFISTLALSRIRVYIMRIMQFSGRGEIAFSINSRPAVQSATPFHEGLTWCDSMTDGKVRMEDGCVRR